MQKIDTSTWKKFSLLSLFDSGNGDVDLQQKDINGKGEFVVSSGEQNNGIIGRTDVKAKIFLSNTITIDMFGNVFYRDFDYKMVTHARIFSLTPKFEMNEKSGLFIVSCLSSLKQLYSYSNMCNWTKIQDMKILLPSKEVEVPDFEYMEQYISELEQERISELEQYLIVTGLNDYELTEEDKNIIEKKIEFKNFKLENILKWQNQKEINPLKINELSTKNEKKYPFYGQSTYNNGIISYLSLNNNVLNNKNSKPTILIHSNNQNIVYVDTPFYLKDGHGATSILQSNWLNEYNALYIISCIKIIISKMFSYQNKATKIALKNLEIQLPIKIDENKNPIIDIKYTYHKDGFVPDFEYMEAYIKAQEKLAIKDVVLLKDKIIDKTKKVVNN